MEELTPDSRTRSHRSPTVAGDDSTPSRPPCHPRQGLDGAESPPPKHCVGDGRTALRSGASDSGSEQLR